MNYFEILINTYINTKDKTYLQNAYFREFKKAEEQYFPPKEFYDGCMRQINAGLGKLDKALKNYPGASLDDLCFDLRRTDLVRRGELTFADLQIMKEALDEAYLMVSGAGMKKLTTQFEDGWENIFKEETWELFKYLEKKYTASDTALKAKYSWIYHFLKDDGIICKQDNYISFLKKTGRVESFSKIQQASLNNTYEDRAKPNLTSLRSKFHSRKQNEIN